MALSALEEKAIRYLAEAGLPTPTLEHMFARPRRWRFDLCWLAQRVAVELEGATWVKGRHTSGAGFRGDCEKYNAAALRGWMVLRLTGDMITPAIIVPLVAHALGIALPSTEKATA